MVSESIFDIIYHKEYTKLKELINSPDYNVDNVDDMGRSPIFFCFVENNYEALLVLLEHDGFRALFNQRVKNLKDWAGMYEFQHAFMSFDDPRKLISLFSFIDKINQQDDNGSTCLHYFVYGLEGYSLDRHMNNYSPESQLKLRFEMNQELKEFFEACIEVKVDFSLKDNSNKTAIESIDLDYHKYFKSSIDFLMASLEKHTLSAKIEQIKDNLENKKVKL